MKSVVEILFLIGYPGKFLRGKSFLREILICYISQTEGRRKLKFGEVGLQVCQKFLREHRAKNFRPECPVKLTILRRRFINDEAMSVCANSGNKFRRVVMHSYLESAVGSNLRLVKVDKVLPTSRHRSNFS